MKVSFRDFRVRSVLFSVVCVVILSIPYVAERQLSFYWLILSVILVLSAFILIVIPSLRVVSSLSNPVELLERVIKTREEKINIMLQQVNHLQNRLLEEEKKFRRRVEDSVDAIFETDEQGRYTYEVQVLRILQAMQAMSSSGSPLMKLSIRNIKLNLSCSFATRC